VNDPTPSSSGSRRQPRAGSTRPDAADQGPSAVTTALPAPVAASRPSSRTRRRVLAATAVVGVLALGGVGAAAIGRAVADTGSVSGGAGVAGTGRVGDHHHGDDRPDADGGPGATAGGQGNGATTPGTGTTIGA
jgi:hypothetical protein